MNIITDLSATYLCDDWGFYVDIESAEDRNLNTNLHPIVKRTKKFAPTPIPIPTPNYIPQYVTINESRTKALTLKDMYNIANKPDAQHANIITNYCYKTILITTLVVVCLLF